MSSVKPSKQRYAFYNAPDHIRRKYLTAKLSDELRAKLGIKRINVRVGDTVKVVRGDWKGHEGKVVKVDYDRIALYIEGVTIKKADGTPVFYPIHPSKVIITKLDLSDKARRKIIERRKGRLEALETESSGEVKKPDNQSLEGR